jgi:hypothetical protein
MWLIYFNYGQYAKNEISTTRTYDQRFEKSGAKGSIFQKLKFNPTSHENNKSAKRMIITRFLLVFL